MNPNVVGLFGTCGNSTWRTPFIEMFDHFGVPYYNPLVENWTPECAIEEAWYLANAKMILLPVTDETYGFGSLGETGFSIIQTLRASVNRMIVIYVAPDVCSSLYAEDHAMADASMRTRRLLIEHLRKVDAPNVYVVFSIQEMMVKALMLSKAMKALTEVEQFSLDDWRTKLSPSAWREIIGQHIVAAESPVCVS